MPEKIDKPFDGDQARAIISRFLLEHPEAESQTDKEDTESLEVKNPKALETAIENASREALKPFEETREFSENRRMEINEHRILNVVPVSSVIVDDNIPLSLQIEKGFRRFLEDESLQFQMLMMQLKRGNDRVAEFVSSLEIDDEGNDFIKIRHRWVEEKFRERGKGYGTMMLRGIESFAKERATKTGKEQTIAINAGQLDVMNWALKNGFKPATPTDEVTLENILNSLNQEKSEYSVGARNYVFPKAIAERHARTRNLKGFTSQYKITPEDIERSVRINFEKTILPAEEKTGLGQRTRERITDLL